MDSNGRSGVRLTGRNYREGFKVTICEYGRTAVRPYIGIAMSFCKGGRSALWVFISRPYVSRCETDSKTDI